MNDKKPLHTPAPWSINEWQQECSDIRIGAIGTPRIASVHIRDCSVNEYLANAHLIAAAPELLALRTVFADETREYNAHLIAMSATAREIRLAVGFTDDEASAALMAAFHHEVGQ